MTSYRRIKAFYTTGTVEYDTDLHFPLFSQCHFKNIILTTFELLSTKKTCSGLSNALNQASLEIILDPFNPFPHNDTF